MHYFQYHRFTYVLGGVVRSYQWSRKDVF